MNEKLVKLFRMSDPQIAHVEFRSFTLMHRIPLPQVRTMEELERKIVELNASEKVVLPIALK